MNQEIRTDNHVQRTLFGILARIVARRIRELPISFYLVIAIIIALPLGVRGFRDLQDPRHLAFVMTLFLVFFGAISYRAIVDGIDIARSYFRERDALLNTVMNRDRFSDRLGS